MAEIGYIAGIFERQGRHSEVHYKVNQYLRFTSKGKAEHVANLLQLKIQYDGQRWFIYLPYNVAVGWYMTAYSLVCEQTKQRFEQALLHWKAINYKEKRVSCEHKDKPYYALNKCCACYKRDYRAGRRSVRWSK